jgi:hypothetical protein
MPSFDSYTLIELAMGILHSRLFNEDFIVCDDAESACYCPPIVGANGMHSSFLLKDTFCQSII